MTLFLILSGLSPAFAQPIRAPEPPTVVVAPAALPTGPLPSAAGVVLSLLPSLAALPELPRLPSLPAPRPTGAVLAGGLAAQEREFDEDADPNSGADSAEPLPHFHPVSPGIYRSAQATEEGFRQAKERGIRTILSLRMLVSAEESRAARKLGLRLVHVPMLGTSLPGWREMDQAIDALKRQELRPILVHCRFGRERTGAVVAAYRVVVEGWSPERAEREALDLGCRFKGVRDYLIRYREHARSANLLDFDARGN